MNKQNQEKKDLNSSLNGNKESAFASKMAKFNQAQGTRKSNAMAPLSNNLMSQREAGGSRLSAMAHGSSGGNLNSSFSALNSSLSQKWAQINSGQKKIGGLTGRPGFGQSASNLAQTVGPGAGGQAQGSLNNSNNKFQSKMTGGFASRMQTKSTFGQNAEKINGAGSPTKIGMAGGNRSLGGGGGISGNSFRARIQGFGGNNDSGAANTSQAAISQNQGTASATNQDL